MPYNTFHICISFSYVGGSAVRELLLPHVQHVPAQGNGDIILEPSRLHRMLARRRRADGPKIDYYWSSLVWHHSSRPPPHCGQCRPPPVPPPDSLHDPPRGRGGALDCVHVLD